MQEQQEYVPYTPSSNPAIVINTPGLAKPVPKVKAGLDEHQAFLNKNANHWLIKKLTSSGKLKALKSGISLGATSLSFWEDLLSSCSVQGELKHKVEVSIDGQLVYTNNKAEIAS